MKIEPFRGRSSRRRGLTFKPNTELRINTTMSAMQHDGNGLYGVQV